MKEVFDKIKRGKYISFVLVICIAFTYAAEFRYYIYENVYSAFNLGNLGEFGTKLSVSVLTAVFAALGWVAGLLTAFLTDKKKINVVTLYWLSGIFAIVALFFTPYNLQLLMPSTIMQNVAMIACIAHLVFMVADIWLFSWAICSGGNDVARQVKFKGTAFAVSAAATALVLAILSVRYKWSFVWIIAVYGCILTVLNVLHAAFPDKDETAESLETEVSFTEKITLRAAVTAMFAAVLIGAYFITEAHIAI